MCFAPQRRALFQHLNFQKWSEHGVFCEFWLGNVLRATTACTFSTSQLPKVVRDRQFLTLLTSKCASRHNGVHFFDISTSKSGPNPWCLYILTCKCASRHNGVQFFISHLASWLRTRRFSEPTFRPSGATNHWKNTVFRDFPTFSRTCIFFLLIFSLLTLLTSAFQLSILSEVSLLNFLRWYGFVWKMGYTYTVIWQFYRENDEKSWTWSDISKQKGRSEIGVPRNHEKISHWFPVVLSVFVSTIDPPMSSKRFRYSVWSYF